MRLLLRVLAFFFVISAVMSLVRGLLSSYSSQSASQPRTRPITTGKFVKDPVCGMYVPEDSAVQGNGNFFCSEECRRKFLAVKGHA
jgi:hypothetical protein